MFSLKVRHTASDKKSLDPYVCPAYKHVIWTSVHTSLITVNFHKINNLLYIPICFTFIDDVFVLFDRHAILQREYV